MMKRAVFGLVVAALVVAAGCDSGSGGDGDGGGGKLTITGLGAYEGKFATAMGGNDGGQGNLWVDGYKVTGNGMSEAVEISNGQVVLPLYTREVINGYGKPVPYTGNDVLDVCVSISPSKTVLGGWEINKGNSVKFSDGIGTLANPRVIVVSQ
jgi:hypothetical protein